MELHTEWTRFPTGGGPMPAYLARPAAVQRPLPGLLVIQEIWGVDDHLQDLTRRFAQAGYVALAPDLYAQGGQRPAELSAEGVAAARGFLDTLPPGAWGDQAARDAAMARLPEERRQMVAGALGALFGGAMRDMSGYTAHLAAAAAFLRTHPASRDQPVGSVGYCMGGALSALLACSDPGMAAAVIYYGSPPPADALPALRCPLLGMYGGDDARITGAVPGFAEALRAAGKDFEYHIYAGAPHAFFNDTRPSYHPEAARDAWARTLMFFARALNPVA